MKRIVIVVALLFLGSLMFGQGVLDPTWFVIDSVDSGSSEAWGIDVDENNEIYWTLSNNQLNQGLDIYCRKFEFGGVELWSESFFYGGIGTQHAYVCKAAQDALYIGGRECTGLINTCDMMLLKVNKNSGELIWNQTKDFSATGYDEIDGLEITADGIYCGGWSQELNSSIYQSDIGLWKVNFDGSTDWVNHLGESTTAEHQDGHFVVDQDGVYAAGLWGGTGIANLYNGHSFLGKFDKSDGELIDSTLFGHQSNNFNDIENALGMTSDGTYLYLTGYTTPISSNDWQVFVAKFDKDLNQIWYTDWGGIGTETARGITVENEIIYVAGLTESSQIMSGEIRDAILLKLDLDGNILSYDTYGGAQSESFQDISVSDGNIYLTGVIENELADKKSMLLAIEDETNATVPEGKLANKFIIAPNPALGNTSLDFKGEYHEACIVNVYNAYGHLIRTFKISAETETAYIEFEKTGLYFIEVVFPGYKLTKTVVNTFE